MINYKELFPKKKYLLPYIQSYTYSSGILNENKAKYITRAFPTIMTQVYFEFSGGLSELVINEKKIDVKKRTYISCGLGSWMDIYQKASAQKSRLVKNFKVELYPHTLYEVFGISPLDMLNKDLNLEDIFGNTETSLLYEELESTHSGEIMIDIFENYFTRKLLSNSVNRKNISPYFFQDYSNLNALSKDIGYSQRWIQKQYLEVFGISFKNIQNNRRFLNVLENMI